MKLPVLHNKVITKKSGIFVQFKRLNCTKERLFKKGYLGYIISSNDKDGFAVQKECRPVYARGKMLLRKF